MGIEIQYEVCLTSLLQTKVPIMATKFTRNHTCTNSVAHLLGCLYVPNMKLVCTDLFHGIWNCYHLESPVLLENLLHLIFGHSTMSKSSDIVS